MLGIELDGARAAGVRWRDRRGRDAVARAPREVVLCAGAIGSPQLSCSRGSGRPDHLRELGIESRVDLPGVGENLQDHPFFMLCFESNGTEDLADAEKPKALLQFLLAPQRPADLERRRGDGLHPHPARPAGRPTSSSSSARPTTTTTASTPTTATRSRSAAS